MVASGGLLVDQSMAAMLPAGSVSALVYANRFVSVVLTLLAGAVSTAIVPHFSRMIAHRDWAGCRHTLRTWVGLTALVSIPIAILLIAGARPLVRVALRTRPLSARMTPPSSPSVLAMYAIQIPFYVTSRVYYRYIVAMRRTDLVLYCGILNLGLDIVLNLVLMHWFVRMHWPGVAGIALATSLWTVSTFFYLWYWSRKLWRADLRRRKQPHDSFSCAIPASHRRSLSHRLCPALAAVSSAGRRVPPTADPSRGSRQPGPGIAGLPARSCFLGLHARLGGRRSGDWPPRLPACRCAKPPWSHARLIYAHFEAEFAGVPAETQQTWIPGETCI